MKWLDDFDHTRIGDAVVCRADALDVLPLIKACSIDFIFTDPPFGHNNNNGDLASAIEAALGRGKSGAPRPILNDGPVEANTLFREAIAHFPRLLAQGGCCCCCCGGGGPDPQFARWSLWLDEVLQFTQQVIWDKGPMGLGWHYRRSYETVLVAKRPGGRTRWFDTSHKVENVIRTIKKIIPRASDHPTPKPVALAAHFISLHTARGHVVLDPFMGGGSTGVASLQLGRRFIGVELDKKWYRKAVRRLKETEASFPRSRKPRTRKTLSKG